MEGGEGLVEKAETKKERQYSKNNKECRQSAGTMTKLKRRRSSSSSKRRRRGEIEAERVKGAEKGRGVRSGRVGNPTL